jgi:dTDP-4-dehydrorhamnose reductase
MAVILFDAGGDTILGEGSRLTARRIKKRKSKMNNIVILGAAGQLGHDLCGRLGSRAVGLTHREVELCDRESLTRALSSLQPRVVINTAAFNFVDDAETRAGEAFAVNAFGVRELSLVCRDLGCRLIHFSTDYVFGLDRSRTQPYLEADAPGPVNAYGTSKLTGECFVRSLCPQHLVIRTCGLYGLKGSGGKGRNFVNTIARLGRERDRLNVVSDQICTPTSVADLADATCRLLDIDATGVLHVTNTGACSWHQFAVEILRATGSTAACEAITTAEYGGAAPRPGYTVLATQRYEQLTGHTPRGWREALREHLQNLV